MGVVSADVEAKLLDISGSDKRSSVAENRGSPASTSETFGRFALLVGREVEFVFLFCDDYVAVAADSLAWTSARVSHSDAISAL